MNTFSNMNSTPTNVRNAADVSLQDGVEAASLDFAASPLPVIGKVGGGTAACGIALAFASEASDACDEDRFALLLVDEAGTTLGRLGPFGDDDVVAVWRDCSARTGLPRMIVREDGSLATVSRQLGRVALGTTRTRRRHGLLNGRRPRFLVRRKTGMLPVRPLIYRGESEIVGGALS
ncbi:DUF6101 family protein [Methylobacterium marchantiae]|uniref:DUF6101 family protein n=1 Tax=Methylobacterium marchantiae TaxID=600331 RepID=A0ABW3X018_9HYPH|nr:hypothetical protein AIGOOFII_2259 [Methylobacterium marchantiae]